MSTEKVWKSLDYNNSQNFMGRGTKNLDLSRFFLFGAYEVYLNTDFKINAKSTYYYFAKNAPKSTIRHL